MTPQNHHSVFAGSADWYVNLARAEFSSHSKVRAQDEAWLNNTSHQDKIHVQRNTNTIFISAAVVGRTCTLTKIKKPDSLTCRSATAGA
jgi:hypothetical protein